jgi:serine/threonine protein kinase/Tfp pilus assembly protein PilF
MGEVYRARDTRLGREVAIKVLPADVASSTDRLARFEREARTVAGLNHPNIVVLHSVEDEDGIRFLTMELVEGQTLSNLVAPGGLPLPKLLELAIPLTDALVAAHEKGVIHRDLKPGNVMVTKEGRVKVLDFGLAKMMGAEAPADGASVTVTADGLISGEGQVVGTVPYMAPEQLRGEAVDARSDLFSLGIILYELATGRRPFTGETSIDVGSSILRDTPVPLSRVRADLPVDLLKLVDHCLEKNPRERIQTALDANNELRRLRKVVERGEPKKAAADKVASIAVLPFVNRSASADDEYFSDGLADELLNVLSKIKGLRVTARTSSFHFKGKDSTIAEIGRMLDVATVLEGSVRTAGSRIRVSVQLVQVSDSSHLWSETYDRTLEDIFAVQDDIAQSVVKELRTTLLGEAPGSDASGAAKADVAQAAKGRGTDPEAHRLYLLARHLIDWRTREDTAKAIGYLKQAIERDPTNALAWAELGRAHTNEVDAGWVAPAEGFQRAKVAVERGLSLEPDLAEGHAVLGRLKMTFHYDWNGAEKSLARALELAPGSAPVLLAAGLMEYSLCRIDAAIDLFRRSSDQDPLSATAYHTLGLALHAADRLEEAETAYRKSLELSPGRVGARALLSIVLPALGRAEESLREARSEPDEGYRLWAEVLAYRAVGLEAEASATLRKLTEKYGHTMAFQIAQTYGAIGDADAAFDWLERAYRQRDSGLGQMLASPRFRPLHGDPRWGAFLRKMGLEV